MLKLNNLTPKGTSLLDSAHFDPSCVKIGQRVWSLRVPQKKSFTKVTFHLFAQKSPMNGF